MRRREPPASLSNEQIAEIILADPVRYPGLMQEWSKMILAPKEKAQWSR